MIPRASLLLVAALALSLACLPPNVGARSLLAQCPSSVGEVPDPTTYCIYCGETTGYRYSCIESGPDCSIGDIALPRCPGCGDVPGPWREEACPSQHLERAGHAVATVTLGELGGGRREAYVLVFGGRRGNTIFSDVLAFSVLRREWSVWCEKWPDASPRSYPTATVVGGEVWLVGGGDTGDVIADVLVFTPATRRWRRPALTGELYLLQRTAHGACLHPQRPDCILLQGGYGRTPCEDELCFLDDLAELNTRTGEVRSVTCIGAKPEPRAYHSFVASGARCYSVGGRTNNSKLIKDKEFVVVWDAASSKWFRPVGIEGEVAPRSSHRALAVPGGVLLFGGAVDKGARSDDLALLATNGRLAWKLCWHGGGGGGRGPKARGAHGMEIAGGRLYVLGGYGEGKQYTADCWSLGLDAIEGCDAAPPASQPQRDAAARGSGGGKVAPEASEWRSARRSAPAAAAVKRQRVAGGPAAARAPAPAAAPAQAAAAPPPAAQQQQQQQQQQLLPAAAPPTADPWAAREAQEGLQAERVKSAALQQQLLDLQRQLAEARADVGTWKGMAEVKQAAARQSNSILMQRNAEVSELQRLLQQARQETGKAEEEVLDVRSLQRRERDKADREAAEREKQAAALKEDNAELRRTNNKLTESLTRQSQMWEAAQSSLAKEQQRAGEARVAAANERERLANALRDAQDEMRTAVAQRDSLQQRLDGEQRAVKEAREEMERQQTLARQAQERTGQMEAECSKARGEAEAARSRLATQAAELDRARAASGCVADAMKLLGRAAENLPGAP
ncbi:kelch domain-containing isoform A [Micractinium conductrix]|uniref:Kelch domain-containing isoform A n=1 Tax=Micractinium conductrix TaxID=554055 RepID=A0A2P6VNB0_9CHLO|nr:kelch domain-containing isoform A [Micractinium conductrix]|eukprot:PSC75591.1 kelch domain-containing isoform A [Micractinium conductrix]